jgi:hypothetical protein
VKINIITVTKHSATSSAQTPVCLKAGASSKDPEIKQASGKRIEKGLLK